VDRRPLGNTGLAVTPVGFGAFKIGRNAGIKYAEAYALPTDAEAERLIHDVLDLGINYIDTAPAYGVSEARIGRAIAGRRDNIVISTKAGEQFDGAKSTYDFSAGALRSSVEQSLRRLGRDVIDVVFLHAHQDDVMIIDETDAVPTLQALKAAGLVRAIGFSGKTTLAGRRALTWADVLMVEYHLDDTSHAGLIAAAAAAGVGIVV
jgi:aryl-alcohol dehydrogenase-like predicted oxidoreductase